MPRYRIELIEREGKPAGSRTSNSETFDLSSDIEAIQRSLEMYRSRKSSVAGYRVIDAGSGKVVDQWTMRAPEPLVTRSSATTKNKRQRRQDTHRRTGRVARKKRRSRAARLG